MSKQSVTGERRPYRKRRRAQLEAETRLRITEAAVDLHGSVGPARTTISAVADRAGVQRATVYRHFPDEKALFEACSSHWRAQHPRPDPALWAKIEDPEQRLRVR
jgi:AcrR family transcriptional regulator